MRTADFVRAIVRQMLPPYPSGGSWAIVTGTDTGNRLANITLQPSNKPFTNVRIGTISDGFNPPIATGTQVWVEMSGATPECITGVFHSDVHKPPTGVFLKAPMSVAGRLSVYGNPVTTGVLATLPAISASQRGDIVVIGQVETVAQTGVVDKLYACLQGSDGALHWIQVAAAT